MANGSYYDSGRPDGGVGGNTQVAPTKPVKGDRWPECPVIGLRWPEHEMVWSRGRLVHPKAVDAPGYREYVDDSGGPVDDQSSSEDSFEVEGY